MARSPRNDAKFRRIYDENLVAIRRYCIRRLPLSDVDDATAEVFLVAWRRLDAVPEGAEARYWLYGVARNVVRNTERSRRRRNQLDLRLRPHRRPPDPGPEPMVVQRSEDAALLRALDGLRTSDQEILRLSIWEELGNTEVAAVLGVSPHTATMRLSRARNRLARKLGIKKDPRERGPIPNPSAKEVNREHSQ